MTAPMRNQIHISGILGPYSCSKSLATTRETIARQILPRSANWEVIVVDNTSRDQPRQAVKSFRDRYPSRFHYIFESKPGKSNALNTGIRASRGNILAFMDHDVPV